MVERAGSPVDSVSDCHPDGQGSNPRGGNICEAIFGVLPTGHMTLIQCLICEGHEMEVTLNFHVDIDAI